MDYDKKLEQARIPKRYWGMSVATYSKHNGDVEAAASAQDYIAYLGDHRSAGTGLLLHGRPGVGKTLLAVSVLQEAIHQDFTALFLTMPHLINLHHKLRDLKDAWFVMKDPEAYQEWIRRGDGLDSLRNHIDFVVIDDVGKEHRTQTSYAEDVFEEIFRVRFDNSLPTILTSNLAPKEWGDYSEAMADFIYEATDVVHVRAQSFRRGEG